MIENLYFGKTYDEIFERAWKKFIRGREDHEFHHFNDSLGMMIYSKEHLKSEMKKRNMFPFDVCEGLAEEWEHKKDRKEKEGLNPSDKAVNIIRSLKMMADKNGMLSLGGRAIQALKEIGAINPRRDYIKTYGLSGDFDNLR